jgi:hypothetical protein
VEERRLEDVEASALETTGEFRAEQVPDLKDTTYVLVDLCQIAQSKPVEAHAVVDRASALSATSQEPLMRLFISMIRVKFHSIRGTALRRSGSEIPTRYRRRIGVAGLPGKRLD